MRIFNFLSVALFLLLITSSCTKDELESLPKSELNIDTKSAADQVELLTVVELLTSIEIDQSIMNEVKLGVDNSLKYGLDEEFRFTDMLNPRNSKLQRNVVVSKLINKMSEKLNTSRSLLGYYNSNSEFFDILSQNNVQFYWPYSEDWDGNTLPTITYNAENGNEDWNYGFVYEKDKQGLIHIDTVIVNDDYIKKYPVWVVNRNETNYADLPDFESGEYIKNGVIFDQPVNVNGRNSVYPPTWKPETDPNLIYSFYIQNMRVFKQHDGALAGGSEMVIKCAYPATVGGMPSPVTVLRKNWSRKEISNSTIKSFSTPLISDWRPEQLQCGLKILEEDNGSGKIWEFKLGVVIADKNYGVDAKIPFNNNDDEIVETIFNRSYINSTANVTLPNTTPYWGIWKVYSEDGVAYSLPILTSKR